MHVFQLEPVLEKLHRTSMVLTTSSSSQVHSPVKPTRQSTCTARHEVYMHGQYYDPNTAGLTTSSSSQVHSPVINI